MLLHVQILICSYTFILHVQFNKEYFGQRHVAINIYNICKGHLGSRGAKHLKIN